jgi:hypothetical protein
MIGPSLRAESESEPLCTADQSIGIDDDGSLSVMMRVHCRRIKQEDDTISGTAKPLEVCAQALLDDTQVLVQCVVMEDCL